MVRKVFFSNFECFSNKHGKNIKTRSVINVKAEKAAALPNLSDMITLFQPDGAYYAYPLVLPHLLFS